MDELLNEKELKEIEDMAVYLDENTNVFVMGYAKELPIVDFVRSLYKAGCRIVHDDAVVVSKEEYSELVGDCLLCKRKAQEQARKETAREIFGRLLNMCYDDDHPRNSVAAGEIRYIAIREYGVEVEE